ncbi:MAG: hypothetical protein A2782_02595 [Candidatus Blackburnbacteria bacterium RIFCSPHIGHO2_01_FULL_43_15b]|uniref:Uncharacterized protein n=1 Tax=Candidatus Blackburnbacteria bacterium RIFCSPHIGHO2_01_FULL_43_15b TaxID=1797513 RepID=A0A1G1V1T1_9BACT|nr:MAG: hypothetical protein A2782_02595 [Candidatus Blackburnbacteria bacterium RIFCSPHIGHO2_01_FULL_43_15b]
MLNIIVPNKLKMVKSFSTLGSRISKTRAREGGASVFSSFVFGFLFLVPPSARKKFWPFNQAGEARNKTNVLYPIFSFPPSAECEASF